MSETKDLLSYKDVQTILGVCRGTVRSLVRKKRLQTVPKGRHVGFRRRDVEKLKQKGWKK